MVVASHPGFFGPVKVDGALQGLDHPLDSALNPPAVPCESLVESALFDCLDDLALTDQCHFTDEGAVLTAFGGIGPIADGGLVLPHVGEHVACERPQL